MATRFLDGGWVTEAGANRPFLLHDGAVWLVERGQVDVFCIRRDGDGRVTGRSYVARVAAERCLIGVDSSGGPGAGSSGVLQAVGSPGTLLRRLPPAVARELFADADAAGETTRLIDGWIDAMCDGLAVDPLPRDCQPIRQTSTIRLDRAVRVSPASGVSWIAHREGRSRLFGRPELPMRERLMPCSVRTWFETTAPAEVAVFSTPTVLATGDVWAGLAAFHQAAIRFALWRMDTSAAVEAFRQRRRLAERSALLQDAFAGLSAAHDAADSELPVRPVDPGSDRAADSLPEACRLVGAALGHRIAPGPVRDAVAAADPVAAIARASGVRVRRVLLDDRWWRSDSGPLLGRTGGDHPRWVALLPAGRSRYTLHDSSDGTRAQVNARLAATLAPVAHTFYRPFPQVVLAPRELIRFGVSGCGSDLVTVVVLGLAGGLLGLATPVATGTLFNTVVPGAERDQLIQVTLLLLACAGATGMFELVRRLAVARVDGRMGAAVQAAVWDRLLSLPLRFFRAYAAGDLAVRAMGIDGMRKALSGATMTAALGGMFSLSNLVLLFYYGGSLAWWATLLLAVAVCVTLAAGYGQLRLQRQIVPLRTRTSGLVLQLLTGISKLRIASAEAYGFAQWARLFSRQRHLQFRSRTVGNWLQVFNAMFPAVALLVIMAAATSGGTTMPAIRTGDYLAFASAFGACLGAMVSISEAAMEALRVVPMYEAARPILDATPEASEAQSDPGSLTGRIETHHITFHYQSGIPPALDDVSIAVRPGEFVAIVGPSGSGKSTLLRVLLGFEQPHAGSVYYDGQDFAGLDVQAVRAQIGVVLQSGRIMAGDLFTNIVGSASHTLDDAWTAARMAGLDDDIRAMPMGMHTVVNEGANTLSGGQRQRLLIARAIVNRPRMIFFDEATSALDNRTQAIVSESLARLNATRIVIAHRLSTIEQADRIHVMARGRIVQSGQYADLITRDGLFADLTRRQMA